MANPRTLLLLFLLHLLVPPSPSHLTISRPDLAALASVKNSLTDIPGTLFFSTWNFSSSHDPCYCFSGVTCSFNRVTTLTLGTGLSGSPGLSGSLSPSISNLARLTQLILYPGFVTGPIPPQLGRLSNLRVLSLTNNRLTGPIPASLSSLRKLHTLDLSNNQLTGSIPPSIFSLPELKVLILASNSLSGKLPWRLSAELLHLDLRSNKLTGGLPLELPSSIRYLSVSNNNMWGPLNGLLSLSSGSEVSELVYLDLSMNQFSGTIPSSLFNPTLTSLFLQRNNFSGGLPTSPSPVAYGEGSIVDLSHNLIGGEITPALARVESLFLNNNHLIGNVPPEYVKSVCRGSTRTLYLQHNFITGFPLEDGLSLPATVALCLSYNCMATSVGLAGCPAGAGGSSSRPASQCAVFNNESTVH
ncbi:hypothetical protein K2173_023185 [Erythroxylum novogranatense]|uniref:Leucine-rich repeat-containing N-terminal plant-type domain-containing protein n=1 Tax=Erythroxylum novogranatense TaxID=1862640 RepID=A0AAV8U811_9ROSI|nr:hypothetical protein K2173_023185 [Erythroxylum novogranatense]